MVVLLAEGDCLLFLDSSEKDKWGRESLSLFIFPIKAPALCHLPA
jgi:hypothetical protein